MALRIISSGVMQTWHPQRKLVSVRATSQSWMSNFLHSRAPQTTYRGAVSSAFAAATEPAPSGRHRTCRLQMNSHALLRMIQQG